MEKNGYRILFMLSLFLTSCATTKIESVKKPDAELTKYKKTLIYVDIQDIQFRKLLEKDIEEQLAMQKKNIIKSIEIIPPLKEYSESDINKICRDNSIDSIIKISVISLSTNNGDSSSVFIPTGNFVWGLGSSDIKLTMAFDIIIYDVNNDEIVIRGTAKSEDENDEIEDCMDNISKSLAKEIVEEFFITPSNKIWFYRKFKIILIMVIYFINKMIILF